MRDGLVTFSTVLSCDSTHCCTGSVKWALRTFGTMEVDVITAPGMDGLLAGALKDDAEAVLRQVRAEAEQSAREHGSVQCLIMGHCGCRANTVEYEEHLEHLRAAKRLVESWGLFSHIEIGVFNPAWDFKLAA